MAGLLGFGILSDNAMHPDILSNAPALILSILFSISIKYSVSCGFMLKTSEGTASIQYHCMAVI